IGATDTGTIVIQNVGGTVLHPSAVFTSTGTVPAGLSGTGCAAGIQPAGTCTFTIVWAPTSIGDWEIDVSVASEATSPAGFGNSRLYLKGRAAPPAGDAIQPI
ncbi:unnamed protein product, partial [Phaeothamnion confervicola]